MDLKDRLKNYFGKRFRKYFLKCDDEILNKTEEIRFRMSKPIVFKTLDGEKFIDENGFTDKIQNSLIAEKEDIRQMLELMSDYSVYTLEEELKNGFMTIKGGFRVGVTGKIVVHDGHIKAMKGINSINIRICREVIGCADKVVKYINKNKIKNILIASAPNCGKTTFLRDVIRQISNNGDDVGVIDERSEIGGVYMGEAQNDIGLRTDILDRCPKINGINMLIRSMSPKYIALDEITEKEVNSIINAVGSGVGVICTAHAESIDDIRTKRRFEKLRLYQVYDIFIMLSKRNGPGTIEGIYDKNLKEVEWNVD